MVVIRIVVGVLILAHGLVHLLYLARDVPEFSFASSWLVPESARRPVALVLMAATVAAFLNNMLILGVAIDIALMAVAAIRPGWVEHIVA